MCVCVRACVCVRVRVRVCVCVCCVCVCVWLSYRCSLLGYYTGTHTPTQCTHYTLNVHTYTHWCYSSWSIYLFTKKLLQDIMMLHPHARSRNGLLLMWDSCENSSDLFCYQNCERYDKNILGINTQHHTYILLFPIITNHHLKGVKGKAFAHESDMKGIYFLYPY